MKFMDWLNKVYKQFSLILIGLGPIVFDFPCISEELTDKSNYDFILQFTYFFRISKISAGKKLDPPKFRD
jgi:hypothetical protein